MGKGENLISIAEKSAFMGEERVGRDRGTAVHLLDQLKRERRQPKNWEREKYDSKSCSSMPKREVTK